MPDLRRFGGTKVSSRAEKTVTPFTEIDPPTGRSSPAMERSVVLPQPLGPSRVERDMAAFIASNVSSKRGARRARLFLTTASSKSVNRRCNGQRRTQNTVIRNDELPLRLVQFEIERYSADSNSLFRRRWLLPASHPPNTPINTTSAAWQKCATSPFCRHRSSKKSK